MRLWEGFFPSPCLAFYLKGLTLEKKKENLHLPYGRQYIDGDDIRAVSAVMAEDLITGGPKVEALEAELCRITGAKYAVACSNGTVALHLACLALGIGPDDLGMTSPISFLASANCVEFCGGRMDFIDIDLSSLCLSVSRLETESRKGRVPRVVIPVDFAGVASDLPAIKALADQYGFYVIEDAAHALGSVYLDGGKEYACGSCAHTDLAVFSFHPVKTITTGEGGAVMTCDRQLADRARMFRNHGMERPETAVSREGEWYYEMTELGYNYRITDLQCALGLSQLEKLNRFKARRREIAAFYNRALDPQSGIILPPEKLATEACPHLYPIQIDGTPDLRRKIFGALRELGIFCQVHYIPIYWQPYYAQKYGYKKGKCVNAEAYYSRCLSLPLFPAMSDEDMQRVVQGVEAALARHR